MSSVTTEQIYSHAGGMAPQEKVRHIITEEMYKTARPSDSLVGSLVVFMYFLVIKEVE